MSSELLATKLLIPPLRPEIISRPKLRDKLSGGLVRKLTIVSAPAGFGKTTLLTDWLESLRSDPKPGDDERMFSWLSLDHGDNDTSRFLSYLIAAIQQSAPSLGDDLLVMIGKSPQESVVPTLSSLVNELAELEYQQVLILDDYHVIDNQEIHQAVLFLLEHSPPQFHLVIATRSNPPLSLSRFRARDQLVDINAEDLSFSREEANLFFSEVMNISLSPEDVQVISARTEGWIAGLQLAALSLKRSENIQKFIKNFSGSNQFVTDYLTDEVLTQLDETHRSFLLQSSILERLSGPLCKEVTGLPESAELIHQLVKNNLFLLPLDHNQQWFRLHHLFADLLRERLYKKYPQLVPELHSRASNWYQDQGMLEQAIEHALAAGDLPRAADLVEEIADYMMMHSELLTLLQWMEKLPPSEMQARPLLTLYQAGAKLISGSPFEDVIALISDVKSDPSTAPSGEISAIQGLIATFRGKSTLSRQYSKEALDVLPENSYFMRSFVAQNMGFAYTASGDLEESMAALQKAVQIANQASIPLISVISLSHIAELKISQGHLSTAERYYIQALDLATDQSGKHYAIAGMPLIGLGEILREKNQLDEAQKHIQEGMNLSEQWSLVSTIDGHLSLARIYEAMGKHEEADREMRSARRQSVAFDASEMDDLMVAYHQARIWISRGQVETAKDWLAAQEAQALTGEGGETKSDHFFVEMLRLSTRIRLELAAGRTQEAFSLLETHQSLSESRGVFRSLMEGWILQALLKENQGLHAGALDALKKALKLSHNEGFVRVFLDEGPQIARLLYRASEEGIYPDFTGKLLADFASQKDPEPLSSGSTIEPLTDREMEILSLIAQGLTNREIANQLVITLRTVKWHTSNIYGKLNVKNRTKAAARARELGILPLK